METIEKEYFDFLLSAYQEKCTSTSVNKAYIENIYYFIWQSIYSSGLNSSDKIDFFNKLKDIKNLYSEV